MGYKQDTMGDIIESERAMVLDAADRYGKFFINASEINDLLVNNFIKSVNLDRHFFAAFFSQIKRHHTLALFSAVRRHHVQAGMNMRQVLEAGSWAAYAIAYTEQDKFYKQDENKIISHPKKLKEQKNRWLKNNFCKGSLHIKSNINHISDTVAHTNIAYAMKDFKFNSDISVFEVPYFDCEDDFIIKMDLWWIANTGYGLMDLFYVINQKFDAIKFSDDFLLKIGELKRENNLLANQIKQHPKFKKQVNG